MFLGSHVRELSCDIFGSLVTIPSQHTTSLFIGFLLVPLVAMVLTKKGRFTRLVLVAKLTENATGRDLRELRNEKDIKFEERREMKVS
jgi:hypothetical protein